MTGNEIRPKDIRNFLERNKILILIGGLAGLMFSAAYILSATKVYEARWQMQVAQLVNANGNYSNSEDPAALIQRLRTPTAYPADVLQSCGVPEDGSYNEYLNGIFKIEQVKNVANAVNMKIVAPSNDQARRCAETITEMIVAQQHNLIEEHMSGRQEQLKLYQQAFHEEQQQLNTIKKTEIGNFGYLASLDKLSWLRARIDSLQEELLLSRAHPAKVVAPVYVPNNPVSPKAGLILLIGALLGLLLGVAYALGREGVRKANMSGS